MRTQSGTPKSPWTWSGLCILGLGLGLGLAYCLMGWPEWVSNLAAGVVAASMCVLLAGLIAERKASEGQHRKSREN